MLNTNNDKTVRSLAKYVFEAFCVRNLFHDMYMYYVLCIDWGEGAGEVAIACHWLGY